MMDASVGYSAGVAQRGVWRRGVEAKKTGCSAYGEGCSVTRGVCVWRCLWRRGLEERGAMRSRRTAATTTRVMFRAQKRDAQPHGNDGRRGLRDIRVTGGEGWGRVVDSVGGDEEGWSGDVFDSEDGFRRRCQSSGKKERGDKTQ